MKRAWRVIPLEGKYYGTIVASPADPDGDEYGSITVWTRMGRKPSEREIANGWTEEDDGMDHVESQEDYEIAQTIATVLNARMNRRTL